MYMRFAALLLHATIIFHWQSPALAGEKSDGVVAGWDQHDGDVLLREMNCAVCHKPPKTNDWLTPRPGPILNEAGQRITPQFLRAYLADPHKMKPGTPMPDVLHSVPKADREATVEKLVHYLVSQGGAMDQRGSGSSVYQIERGRVLFHQVGCVACHEPTMPPPSHKSDLPKGLTIEELRKLKIPGTALPRESVSFGDLAMKTTVDKLAEFLMNPRHIRPSGRMPSLNLNQGEANMIAAFLLRDQADKTQKGWGVGLDLAIYSGNYPKMPDFTKLKPREETTAKNFDLNKIKLKTGKLKSNFAVRFRGAIQIDKDGQYTFYTNSDDGSVIWINGKEVVNNDGMHAPQERSGTVRLTKGRHIFEMGFTQGGGGWELQVRWRPPGVSKKQPIPPGILLHSAQAMIPKNIADFKLDADKAKQGKQLFASLGCVSCHQTRDKFDVQPSTPLAMLNPNKAGGCLSDAPTGKAPHFGLSAKQRTVLQGALAKAQGPKSQITTAQRLDRTMSAFRCYSCHSRDGKGGPDVKRAPYFDMIEEVDLGDEGRFPPSLDLVGAKLTQAGFESYLFEAHNNRTYMGTRMPQYGKDNVGFVPPAIRELDQGKVNKHNPEFSARLIDDGRKLVGKNGLGCINCHVWGKLKMQGAEGLDLLKVANRLEPSWFHAFMTDPQDFRPRTRMPTSWPKGKSFFPKIQGGNMHKQIDAIWAYLSVGAQGGIPAGLSPNDQYILAPTDDPIVFRTFLNGVGAHAITVGFRQRTHTAFDALRVRLAMAWSGDFVSAKPSWDGRAGQYASITSPAQITMPPGSPLAMLADSTQPWPKIDMKSKLPPKGYNFFGYRYGKEREPIFQYGFGDIEVEETPSTTYHQKGSYLKRSFVLTSPENTTELYARVAVGDAIIAGKDGSYTVDKKFQVRATNAKLQLREVDGQRELLAPIRFEKAPNGKWRAQLDVELIW